MHDTGLDLPAAEVEDGRVLWLEDVAGRPGTEFTLADHERFGSALGRWQARGPLDAPWTSRRFLWILASCVKYAWLLPGMLARAAATEQRAYHEIVDAEHLYRQRGLVLAHLVGWCDEALALLEAGR